MYDLIRVAACVPDVRVCDVNYNLSRILMMIDDAVEGKVDVLCFPELAVTGYTCADMFFQDTLLDASDRAVGLIADKTRDMRLVLSVGAPVRIGGQLYNGAYTIYDGKIRGITLKTFMPNYGEFYEKRWFTSSADALCDTISSVAYTGEAEEYMIPVGADLIYNVGGVRFGVEICEDLFAAFTPSVRLAQGGAEMILNLSASNETIGKKALRRRLVSDKSLELISAYVYASAGAGESTTDLCFSGHGIISLCGRVLAENKDVCDNDYMLVTDVDLGRVRADRLKNKTYGDSSAYLSLPVREIMIPGSLYDCDGAYLNVKKHPFVPASKDDRLERCRDIFAMQVAGLTKRLSVTGPKMVVGVSGGMDSTLTLLVAAAALKKMGLPATNLTGITMPAFGTTERTKNNATLLMEALGCDVHTIPIGEACMKHFEDIGHDPAVKDVTYENVQARERTQVLMDYANKIGAIVVGTGDLSELALGWCTYNGDQMSMYGVNASIPKTLVRWMIETVADLDLFPGASVILKDITDTPISPELLPPDENGNISQKTEDNIGPYELHDFFIYYMMRFSFRPAKIFYLAAEHAFKEDYSREDILKWMKMFYKRFFTQQFKRSCMPDGVKVGTVALSPRGDLRMPSDAVSKLWLDEINRLS